MTSIHWESGTVVVRDVADPSILPPSCSWDERTRCWRAPAVGYADVVMALHRRKLPYDDRARGYEELPGGLVVHGKPRPYQEVALRAWQRTRGRGVVVLPTGAGKSWLACLAIDDKRRSTLVIAPTLDLVRQWYDLLRSAFGQPVGIVGGGDHVVEALTVTTYDSAYIHMEHLGRRFGMVVFDEVHHLPGAAYSMAARMCLAPFRLGLSAVGRRDRVHHDDAPCVPRAFGVPGATSAGEHGAVPRRAGVAFAAPGAGEAPATAAENQRAAGPQAHAQTVLDVAVGALGAAVVAGVRGGRLRMPVLWAGDAAAGGGDAARDAAGAVVTGLVGAWSAGAQQRGRSLKRERRARGGASDGTVEVENELEGRSWSEARWLALALGARCGGRSRRVGCRRGR